MAKRNKSQAIRAVLADKPAASVKEIQALLAAKRIKVSPALIHQVRGKSSKASTNGHISVEGLFAAKAFVKSLGSVEAAKAALDSFAKLTQ